MRQTSKDITTTFGATGCPSHTVTVPKGSRVSPIAGEPQKVFVEDLSWLDRNSMAWHDANYYGIHLDIADTEEPEPLERLRHHVTGAIERGEATAIVERADKTPTITEQLETMVDRHGLLHIVTGLSLICGEKAIHIQTNWQDKTLAKVWGKAATVLDKAVHNIPKEIP